MPGHKARIEGNFLKTAVFLLHNGYKPSFLCWGTGLNDLPILLYPGARASRPHLYCRRDARAPRLSYFGLIPKVYLSLFHSGFNLGGNISRNPLGPQVFVLFEKPLGGFIRFGSSVLHISQELVGNLKCGFILF